MNTNCSTQSYGSQVNRLYTLADALFGERATPAAPAAPSWVPPVDVLETENAYQLTAELPGVNGSEVKVVVRDGVLSVSGERHATPAGEGVKTHLIERLSGAFQRRFGLPKDANGEAVSAEFKNGLLHITVPKREEVKPKEIEVKIAN